MPDLSLRIEHKKATVIIDAQQYSMENFISLNDVIMLTENLDGGHTDYRHVIAAMIFRKIQCEENQFLSVERIAAQDDLFFTSYIDSLLQDDDNLKSSYKKFVDEKDVCYRLILAVDDEWKEYGKSIGAIFQKINIPKLNIGNGLAPILKSYIEESQKPFNGFGEAVKAIIDPIQKLSAVYSEWAERFGQFKNILSGIHIPALSEERKEKLIKSFQQWGEYGWTMIPEAPLAFYNNAPNNRKDANKAALALCGAKEMKELFSKLRETKGIKKSDLEEAVLDFQNKQYKSCAMMVFSMIDAKLIRLQRNEDRNPNTKRRSSGKAAAEKLLKRIKEEKRIEQTVFLLLSYESIFACLQSVFKDGGDFSRQTDVINRNFIDHGMLTRNVLRKDCVQLLLLLYNLMDFLNTMVDK